MADPIIRILIKEEPGGATAPKPGEAAPGKTPEVKSAPESEKADEAASKVAHTLLAMFGRLVPGGQRTLKLFGLDKAFEDVAEKISPTLKRISESVKDFLKDLLGAGEKKAIPGAGDKTTELPEAEFHFNKNYKGGDKAPEYPDLKKSGYRDTDTTPNLGNPDKGDAGKKVADDMVFKNPGGGAEGAEGAEALGGLEAAAGPIGVAILAIGILNEAVGAFADTVADGIRSLGTVGAEIVHNDPGAAMKRVAEGVTDWLDSVPLVGHLLSALPKVLLAAVDAVTAVRDAFLESAHKLAGYSGAISGAEAMAEVRHILADLEEAQRLGPQLAQVVTLQSEIEVEFQKAMQPLKEDLLEILIPIMEVMKSIAGGVRIGAEVLHQVISPIAKTVGASIHDINEIADWFQEHWPWGHKDKSGDDFNDLLHGFQGIDPGKESGENRPVGPPPNDGFAGGP